MSQRYKVIHDFQSVNLSQSQLQFTNADLSITLGAAQSGDIVTLNATGGSVVILPSPSTGLLYRFVITNIGAHTLTAPSACINGAVANSVFNTGSNLATGTAKTSIASTVGSAIGDSFSLMGTGTTYVLSGNVSNFNAVKFA
jgi:hypothetical protein